MRKLTGLLMLLAAVSQGASAEPAHDHPLLGIWKLELPDVGCSETYHFRGDGTSLVTSAEEVSESEFKVPDKPSSKGFYRLEDKIVKDNGKKDCWGGVTKVPKTSTNYIMMNPAGDRFIMCDAEDGRHCIGPFVKVEGGDI